MTRKRKDDGDYHDEPPREPHREEENAVKVHEAYLTHRLGGGEPATPEAYPPGARAVREAARSPALHSGHRASGGAREAREAG